MAYTFCLFYRPGEGTPFQSRRRRNVPGGVTCDPLSEVREGLGRNGALVFSDANPVTRFPHPEPVANVLRLYRGGMTSETIPAGTLPFPSRMSAIFWGLECTQEEFPAIMDDISPYVRGARGLIALDRLVSLTAKHPKLFVCLMKNTAQPLRSGTTDMLCIQRGEGFLVEQRAGDPRTLFPEPRCAVCGTAVRAYCDGCRGVAYCSLKCQRRDAARHAPWCAERRVRRIDLGDPEDPEVWHRRWMRDLLLEGVVGIPPPRA